MLAGLEPEAKLNGASLRMRARPLGFAQAGTVQRAGPHSIVSSAIAALLIGLVLLLALPLRKLP